MYDLPLFDNLSREERAKRRSVLHNVKPMN
jgi:hypothetical protein